MAKEIEREIEQLYEFLKIDTGENKGSDQLFDVREEKRIDFFEKRWDSSFFTNTSRY